MSYNIEHREGIAEFFRFRKDPIAFVADMGRRSVDIRCMKFFGRKIYQVNHPDLIREVMVTHDWNFIKARGLRSTKPLLGDGLLTSEGELHRRQRRLVQPAFHSARLASYARMMVECAAETSERWKSGQEYAIDQEMMRLTLNIVGKTLFTAELEEDAAGVGRSLKAGLRQFVALNRPIAQLVPLLRRSAEKKARQSRAGIEQILGRIIAEHRERPEDYDDMLAMLIRSDEESASGYMADELLLDECLTLFLAGHETTSNALTWTWYLLTQHPEAAEQMQAELRQVLGGRLPSIHDLPLLEYTGRVFMEALRLYPPAWIIGREAVTTYRLGDVEVPAGGTVLMSPYATQRDPRFWERPEEFLPERWTDAASEGRPKFAFFPFGAGTRVCIGEHFARMEGVLLIATLAQRWRLALIPGQTIAMWPQITLRPRDSIRMQAEAVGAAV